MPHHLHPSRPPYRTRPLVRGLVEMLAIVSAFVALGLLGQSADLGAGGGTDAYPSAMAGQPGTLWLVDGYNVLCSGVLGGRERNRWWSEERRQELLARLEGLDEPRAEIWVVFDGERAATLEPARAGRVHTVFAPSADDWLVAEVGRRVAEERSVAVVTADRRVAGRSRHRGARVVAPRELLGRCMS